MVTSAARCNPARGVGLRRNGVGWGMLRRPVIVDCDPGWDDLIALMVVLSAREVLDLKAVTTVFGNEDVEATTRNALALLALAGWSAVPVFRGEGKPLRA